MTIQEIRDQILSLFDQSCPLQLHNLGFVTVYRSSQFASTTINSGVHFEVLMSRDPNTAAEAFLLRNYIDDNIVPIGVFTSYTFQSFPIDPSHTGDSKLLWYYSPRHEDWLKLDFNWDADNKLWVNNSVVVDHRSFMIEDASFDKPDYLPLPLHEQFI